jgi:hypothetical protein
MEGSTGTKATSDGTRLNRMQMARALREGADAEGVRTGEHRPWNAEHNQRGERGLRQFGASVTLAMLLASTLTSARITTLRADSLGRMAAASGHGGSIPGSPSPSVGSAGTGQSLIQDTNQEQQKMFSKITGVTAAIAVGASVTVAGAQNAAVQWKVSDGGNGHWYQCLRTTGSGEVWNTSQDAAIALGGHLATLTSQQENSWVYELSVAQNAWSGRGGPLLGGYKLPNNSFRWVTDEPWSYTSWLPGEPSSGLWEPYLNFLGPQGTTSSSATWNDTDAIMVPDPSGDQTYAYIVEWSADCNNDGIVDYGQCHDGTLPDYNGNNIPDCCERGEPCVISSYPVQWKVGDGGNGHWYGTLPGTGGNWYARAIEAEQKGGFLATVSDAAEFAFVQRVSPWIYYLGGYRIDPVPPNDPTDGWRWVTGEPFPYSLRCPGWYPDSERWITAAAWQDCLGESDNSGPPYYYMVEWSADCNNDGTVDYGQILTGQLTDANGNGAPDTCEFSDCNLDGIADAEQVKRGQLPDYDGNNIPDCCDRGEACVVGSYPVQWRTAEGGNGHWYQVSTPENRTWQSWNDWAIDFGGHLATVTSAAERDFIQPHVRTRIPLNKGAVLGARQDRNDPTWSEPGGGWKWITGEPWSWTNWTTWVENPSNSPYGECSCEDYLSLGRWAVTEDGAGNWNDYNGNLAMEVGAILEWSADCNNDGTVDYGQILRGELPDINRNGTPDTCECIGDIYVDHAINGADLGALLAYWGPVTSSAASRACDLNGDGVVNGSDLGILLAYWGTCGN